MCLFVLAFTCMVFMLYVEKIRNPSFGCNALHFHHLCAFLQNLASTVTRKMLKSLPCLFLTQILLRVVFILLVLNLSICCQYIFWYNYLITFCIKVLPSLLCFLTLSLFYSLSWYIEDMCHSISVDSLIVVIWCFLLFV